MALKANVLLAVCKVVARCH